MPETDNELIRVRREKLEKLRAEGIDPYPNSYHRTHNSDDAINLLKETEDNNQSEDHAKTDSVSVAGRIVRFRSMGKASFADVQDGVGKIQILFRRNNLPDNYDNLSDLDLGDWIGVEGPVFRTRTGEATIEVENWSILSKSLRNLPEKWHGLTDTEARFRQRYLDLIANDEARRVASLRSNTISAMRRFMDNRGFMEVETPILVQVPAGGTARPFATHHNALDRDLFLRIATELPLKQLIIGGMEKVYEIGRVFRNEGVDATHNPEFTTMESYEAFANYTDVMEMVEQLVHSLAQEVLGSSTVAFGDETIDFSPPWPRLDLRHEIKARSGIDFLECDDVESLKRAMAAINLDVDQQLSWGGLLDKLLSDTVEPHLIQPSFLLDYPVQMSPLAKKKQGSDSIVERFEGFVAGMEICNAFTELNDPVDQRDRMQQQEALRSQFDEEDTDRLDEAFLLALEHGMPPTGGLGIGVDRLAMLFSGQRSIREVVLFPQLRSR